MKERANAKKFEKQQVRQMDDMILKKAQAELDEVKRQKEVKKVKTIE